ncbi:MAG: cation transporter [Saccharofermentans sp.]|nr:cation transporter [Saccharofermentans sp.]
MKKVFELDEVDCANCARKMQEAVAKIDGVDSVTVNFFTQKMTLEAADDKFDAVLKEALKVLKKVEPDCEVIVK